MQGSVKGEDVMPRASLPALACYHIPMKGYLIDIEKETRENTDYRRVLYTGPRSQLVLMSLPPGVEIGEETHRADQFIRIEAGEGKAVLNGEEHMIKDGDAVVVPEGTRHNFINTGSTDLKLYTLYAPPQHEDGTIERTKADEREEQWTGETTEEA